MPAGGHAAGGSNATHSSLFSRCRAGPRAARQSPLTPEQQAKIDAALPTRSPARPRKPRRLLVVTLAKVGFHAAIASFVQYPVYSQWPWFGRAARRR